MKNIINELRRWRRAIKNNLPFVRRREYKILESKYRLLIKAINGDATTASSASITPLKMSLDALQGDICLFVTFAANPTLKSHAAHHIKCLIEIGIKVVLIVNKASIQSSFEINEDLKKQLSAIFIRENTGFDFGAWAHVFSQMDRSGWQRLYLINDSMVGPVNSNHFEVMLRRIRESKFDVIGLTESIAPERHLQSYFLVLNKAAFIKAEFVNFMLKLMNFPSKGQVVDVYEINLTRHLEAAGLRWEALFPALSTDVNNADDTAVRWESLLSLGFPYVKTRIVQLFPDLPLIVRLRLDGQVDSQI